MKKKEENFWRHNASAERRSQNAIPGLSSFRTVSVSSTPFTSSTSNQLHFHVFFTPLSMAFIWPGTTRSRSIISFLLDVILTDVRRLDCIVTTKQWQWNSHSDTSGNKHTHTHTLSYCKTAGPDEDTTLDSFQGCITTWFSTQLACHAVRSTVRDFSTVHTAINDRTQFVNMCLLWAFRLTVCVVGFEDRVHRVIIFGSWKKQ